MASLVRALNICIHLGVSVVPHKIEGSCQCLHRVKQSKTDPFHQEVFIFLGCSSADIFPVHTITQYLAARGAQQGPFFLHANRSPLSRASLVQKMRQAWSYQDWIPRPTTATVFELVQPLQLPAKGLRMPSSKCWADGKAQLTFATSKFLRTSKPQCL